MVRLNFKVRGLIPLTIFIFIRGDIMKRWVVTLDIEEHTELLDEYGSDPYTEEELLDEINDLLNDNMHTQKYLTIKPIEAFTEDEWDSIIGVI